MKKNPIKLESKNFKIAESTHGILHLVPKSETKTKKLRNNYKRQFNKLLEGRSFLMVEGGCAIKHPSHILHIGHVPIVERLVEGACVVKHTSHM